MKNEVLVALITKFVENKIAGIPVTHGPRGPRGHNGIPGKDFDFNEHEDQIRQWAKDYALKFEDLSDEQIQSLKGRDGNDGRDGRPGRDGQDFDFAQHSERISGIIRSTVEEISESLKLKFSDLDNDDIEQLRGPRGRDGRDGRDFVFDEHREYFDQLRPKFKDFTDAEREELKLKFQDLSQEEKALLSLKYDDLTEEQRIQLRGPRGARGQKGSQGIEGPMGPQGIQGKMGPRGVPGATGMTGPRGATGKDGFIGKDAPYVVDIDVKQVSQDKFYFIFHYSDGTKITTENVELPDGKTKYVFTGGGYTPTPDSGGGGSGTVVSVNAIGPDGDGNIELNLGNLLDVDTTGVVEGNVLTFRASDSKWIPTVPSVTTIIKKQTIAASSTVEITDMVFDSAVFVDAIIELTASSGTMRQPINIRMYFTDIWNRVIRDEDDTLGLEFTHDDTTGQVSVENPNAAEVKIQWKITTIFEKEI